MPRIRSIKPEFATDGKIRRLSDTTALFFVLLWNHCDDRGYFELDTWELAMKTARWRSQDIPRLLEALERAGLVRLSRGPEWPKRRHGRSMEASSPGDGQVMDEAWTGHGVGMVASWSHQRIDKPRSSKWEGVEITWDDANQFRESSEIVPRKDRIGRDRRGEDPSPGVQAPAVAPKLDAPSIESKKQEAPTARTWEAYSKAYQARHKTAPVRNATVNAQLAQFVKRLGQEEAPQVAAFFLTHNDQFYAKNLHPVGLMLKDAEKLRTEWFTGRKMTGTQARLDEGVDYHRSQLDRIARGEL